MEKFIKFLKELGLEPVEVRIPTQKSHDYDIDKVYNDTEAIIYRKIKTIAESDVNNVKWNVVSEILYKAVDGIAERIRSNNIKYPEEIKDFVINCCAICEIIDEKYRNNFNLIKDFRDSYRPPKSIDDMNADELREYIKKHNIK